MWTLTHYRDQRLRRGQSAADAKAALLAICAAILDQPTLPTAADDDAPTD